MSITDELRAWANEHLSRSSTIAIADRIDAEHQKAEDEWRAKNGDMWLKGYAACHEELMEGHPVIVEDLEKAGWVKFPVDVDGVPWHIGDVTENGQTVSAMGLNKHGWHFVGTVNDIDPAIHRHYHAPTVEDVLREFAEKVIDSQIPSVHPTYEEAIAEYAAKLRLAGDAE